MEKSVFKTSCRGKKVWTGLKLSDLIMPVLALGLKAAGAYRKGYANALKPEVVNFVFKNSELPDAFHGYKILFLTDLHLDALPGVEQAVTEKALSLTYDLCLMGGDFRAKSKGPFHQIIPPLIRLIQNLKAKDGVYAVPGNHDSCRMASYFETIGLNMLIDETLTIEKGGARIKITGVDDPHYYFTALSAQAMAESGDGFKILLAHTPEICDVAASNGYQLYLCGHTHGGQICLPNRKAFVTHLFYEKDKYSGEWQSGEMTGYTSRGAGVSGIPVRFFCPPEITLITLEKS